MDTQHKNRMKSILKEYLNHITYIDDEFNVSWEEDVKEEFKRPRRSEAYGDNKNINEQDEAKVSKDSLWDFCIYMQEKYPCISLIPVPYFQNMEQKTLQNYIDTAKLLVIDWNLDEGAPKTAINVIKESNFKNLFKLCVIYTSDIKRAKDDFYENMGYKEETIKHGKTGNKNYFYVIDNANLFMLCDKSQFSFDDIIQEFTEIFINEMGYFSISFIQMFSNMEKQIPRYLNDFKEPFDSLFLLQTISDNMPLLDLNHVLDNMVIGRLKSDIHLDEAILEGIHYQKIEDIIELVNNSPDFETRLWQGLKRICESKKGCKKAIYVLEKIGISDYKELILEAVSNKKQLFLSIQEAGRKFAEKYLEIKFAEDFSGIDNLGQKQRDLMLGKYKKAERKEVKEHVINAIPVFLLMLLEPENEWNQTLQKLICMLKIHRYGENEIKLSDIFADCYEADRSGNMYNCRDWDLIHNKIKHGDIFFRYRTESGKKIERCYLCIMPECHVMRPEKVDGKLQMIEGVVEEKKTHKILRQSEHLTVLPNPLDESKTLFITWQFHNIYSLDLECLKKVDYLELYREYRLDEDYIQQIVGEFISFYSKVGVEEIFAKHNSIFSELLVSEANKNLPDNKEKLA